MTGVARRRRNGMAAPVPAATARCTKTDPCATSRSSRAFGSMVLAIERQGTGSGRRKGPRVPILKNNNKVVPRQSSGADVAERKRERTNVQPLCCVADGAPGMPSAMTQSKRCDPARSEHAPIGVSYSCTYGRVSTSMILTARTDDCTRVCRTSHIGVILPRSAIGVRSYSRMLLAFHFKADMANTLLRQSGTAMHGLTASMPGSSRIKGPFRCRNANPCSRVRPSV
jgi:hypothetical protein